MGNIKKVLRKLLETTSSIKAYHVSNKKFNKFEKKYNSGSTATDMGYHFGTVETSRAIIDQIISDGRHDYKEDDSFYEYKVELSVNNPIILSENRLGSWSPSSVIIAIFDERVEGITEEIEDDFFEDVIKVDGYDDDFWSYNQNEKEMHDFVTAFVKQLGYDHIQYENEYEKGGTSFLVFDPSKIKILSVKEV